MDLSLIAVTGAPAPAELLARCNARTEQYGLCLTAQALAALERGRRDALRDSGRVELGGGILERLAEAFADSPYLSQECFAETLAELQELFYHFKTAARETLPDDELLLGLRRAFDGPAGGDTGYLAGLSPAELWAEEAPPEGFEWQE